MKYMVLFIMFIYYSVFLWGFLEKICLVLLGLVVFLLWINGWFCFMNKISRFENYFCFIFGGGGFRYGYFI